MEVASIQSCVNFMLCKSFKNGNSTQVGSCAIDQMRYENEWMTRNTVPLRPTLPSKLKIEIKYEARHSFVWLCIFHIIFKKTIQSFLLDKIFNYRLFPSRLILLLKNFPFTLKVLDNDFNIIHTLPLPYTLVAFLKK